MSDIETHLAESERTIRSLAAHYSSRFKLSRDLRQDLEQEGRLVLLKAHADGYDHNRGTALMTYAYRTCQWRMRDYAQAQASGPMVFGDVADLEQYAQQGATFRQPSRSTTGVYIVGPGASLDAAPDAAAA